jgi:hypothetical protein
MACPVTDNPASCETGTVIRFLHAKNMSDEEIHHELCVAVYGQNVTSEELQDNGVQSSKMGKQMFTVKSKVVGHLYVVSDDLVQSERRPFTI